MASNRIILRRTVVGVAVILVGIVLVDALELFDDKSWTKISHGNHSHFVPHALADGVSLSDCPQRAPAANEVLSGQCQLLALTDVDGTIRYIPSTRNPAIPDERFPSRPPGPGVIIGPNGELASADAH